MWNMPFSQQETSNYQGDYSNKGDENQFAYLSLITAIFYLTDEGTPSKLGPLSGFKVPLIN